MKKTAMQKLIDWVGNDLKLEGYEHLAIITKAIELRAKDEKEMFVTFFTWFRSNGELYIGKSIEQMIEIFYQETYVVRAYDKKPDNDPEYPDEIYEIKDWDEMKWQMYDQGRGYWMKDGLISNDDVDTTKPEDATHVIWHSK